METVRNAWLHRKEIAMAVVAAAVAWTPIATLLARKIPRPPATSAWWKRALYDIFVDTPSWMAAVDRLGVFGNLFNLPGAASRQPEDNSVKLAQPDNAGPIDVSKR